MIGAGATSTAGFLLVLVIASLLAAAVSIHTVSIDVDRAALFKMGICIIRPKYLVPLAIN